MEPTRFECQSIYVSFMDRDVEPPCHAADLLTGKEWRERVGAQVLSRIMKVGSGCMRSCMTVDGCGGG